MSKKTIEKHYCDICGEEKKEEELKNFPILTYSTFSSTDGAAWNPSVFGTNVMVGASTVDICMECAIKVAVVKEIGVMEEKYKYTGGFKGKKIGNKF